MAAKIGCLVCNYPISCESDSGGDVDLCQECIDLNINDYMDTLILTDDEIYEVLTQDDPPPELYMTIDDEDDSEILSILYGDLYEYYNSMFDIYDYFGIDKYDPNAEDELEAIMGSS